jgi:hypothetical protein
LEGQTCLPSGGAPDSPVHHRTVTVAVWCAISFLLWRIRPLVLGGSWRIGHCPVHTGQSGAPCRPLLRATRRPRIARPTVALATVGSPDSPMNYSRTPLNFSRERPFTGDSLTHRTLSGAHRKLSGALPDSPVCQTELRFGCTKPSLFLILFSLFIALRQNMLVLKTMY